MICIYGAGGHGKVALHTLISSGKEVAYFVDDNMQGTLCNLPIIPSSELTQLTFFTLHFAIGDNTTRSKLQKQWHSNGINPETAIHPTTIIYSGAKHGLGTLLAAGSIIGPDAYIGEGCIINHNAVVDHDCIIGDFCHIAPSATLGGGVKLGSQCLIGAGAIILPYLNIGNNVTVGAGAVVTHDLPDDVTVAGCPAREITKIL